MSQNNEIKTLEQAVSSSPEEMRDFVNINIGGVMYEMKLSASAILSDTDRGDIADDEIKARVKAFALFILERIEFNSRQLEI